MAKVIQQRSMTRENSATKEHETTGMLSEMLAQQPYHAFSFYMLAATPVELALLRANVCDNRGRLPCPITIEHKYGEGVGVRIAMPGTSKQPGLVCIRAIGEDAWGQGTFSLYTLAETQHDFHLLPYRFWQ